MNRVFIKAEKPRQSKSEKHRLSLSFSVLSSLHIRVIKRVFVCTNLTVTVTKRVYDVFFIGYLYSS